MGRAKPDDKIFCAPNASQDEKMGCVQFSTTRGSQTKGRNRDEARQSCFDAGVAAAPFFLPSIATAQSAKPTADQNIQLSVFGAASGDYTGLSGGRNLSVTAGIDLALAPGTGRAPHWRSAESTPSTREPSSPERCPRRPQAGLPSGHRMHPYGDFLFGRGQMNYTGTPCNATGEFGYVFGNNCYQVSTSYVYSPGAGFDYDSATTLSSRSMAIPAMGHRANRLGKALFHPRIHRPRLPLRQARHAVDRIRNPTRRHSALSAVEGKNLCICICLCLCLNPLR